MSQKSARYVIVPEDNVFNDTMVHQLSAVSRHAPAIVPKNPAIALTSSMADGAGKGHSPATRLMRLMETDAGRIRLIDSIGEKRGVAGQHDPRTGA